MNRFIRFTALVLEPQEREFILGDLAESGSSGTRAFFDVLDLVFRRQLLVWRNWRPWFALIGIVAVSGFYLSRMYFGLSVSFFEQVTAWRHFGVHYNVGVTSFRYEVVRMSFLAAAIFCWTAVNASVLVRFSGRAIWLTGLFFSISVLHSSNIVDRGDLSWWTIIKTVPPLGAESACLILPLFVVPAGYGALGRLSAIIPAAVLCTILAAVLSANQAYDLQRFSNGAFPAPPWSAVLAPYALVSWPALLARRH